MVRLNVSVKKDSPEMETKSVRISMSAMYKTKTSVSGMQFVTMILDLTHVGASKVSLEMQEKLAQVGTVNSLENVDKPLTSGK